MKNEDTERQAESQIKQDQRLIKSTVLVPLCTIIMVHNTVAQSEFC